MIRLKGGREDRISAPSMYSAADVHSERASENGLDIGVGGSLLPGTFKDEFV